MKFVVGCAKSFLLETFIESTQIELNSMFQPLEFHSDGLAVVLGMRMLSLLMCLTEEPLAFEGWEEELFRTCVACGLYMVVP